MSQTYNLLFESHGDIPLPELQSHESWLSSALEKLSVHSADLLYIICSDQELLQINRDTLNHDYYTDVITFDMTDEYSLCQIEADIYISLERVQENAAEFGQDFETEFRRVLIHGVLHLLGYTDQNEQSKTAMRAMENKLLERH